jgi:hypothetical protein
MVVEFSGPGVQDVGVALSAGTKECLANETMSMNGKHLREKKWNSRLVNAVIVKYRDALLHAQARNLNRRVLQVQ